MRAQLVSILETFGLAIVVLGLFFGFMLATGLLDGQEMLAYLGVGARGTAPYSVITADRLILLECQEGEMPQRVVSDCLMYRRTAFGDEFIANLMEYQLKPGDSWNGSAIE